jgi:hypothetical protein
MFLIAVAVLWWRVRAIEEDIRQKLSNGVLTRIHDRIEEHTRETTEHLTKLGQYVAVLRSRDEEHGKILRHIEEQSKRIGCIEKQVNTLESNLREYQVARAIFAALSELQRDTSLSEAEREKRKQRLFEEAESYIKNK